LAHIPHNIVKFCDNVDIVVGLEDSKKINQFWNTSYLNNSTRTFLFKLYNNTLGYNTTVSHFVRNHSCNCTFCDVVGNEDINDETPFHLLYDCEQVGELIDSIFKWVTDDNDFGSMTDHDGLTSTFHGSRIREGLATVNQSVSMTFDPNKLTCVVCKNEHAIVEKKPVTVFSRIRISAPQGRVSTMTASPLLGWRTPHSRSC
jgi:hypothetical protein